jgi:Na+-translocating ferredoxin:NAD+ oxidoreductase subunit B
MENDVYEKLIDWLVTTFRALPGIDTPEFREVVYFSYTPEEALLAVQMGPEGGKLDELATKTGMKKEDLQTIIESMGKKGTIYKEPASENPTYRPLGIELPGLLETAGWGDPSNPFTKSLLKLWGKFKPIYVNEGIAGLGKHSIVWCMTSALPSDAKSEENLFEQVKKSDYAAVSLCACRNIEKHAVHGTACDCIMECCLSFGKMARWAVEQGHARHITMTEALKILDACEKKGQVHAGIPGLVMCNCCSHACITLYAQKFGKPHTFTQNHFYAVVDSETCISCEACVERCPVGAIQLETIAVVDQAKCIGCGACATGCEENSIVMVRRSEEEIARLDGELADGFIKMASMTTPDPLFFEALQNI